MADKLYPPTLAGTIPPFIKGTSILLEVPFFMNRLVSINQVGKMWLRIRDANTDIDLGTISTTNFEYNEDKNCYIAIFNLTSIAYKLIISNYYKIQIAYANLNDNIGYYSTVAITKCTVMPEVVIQDLTVNNINNNKEQYIGIYSNIQDPSEKNYQYMFELNLEDGTVLDTTNWCYHNANNDTLSYQSKDIYNLLYDLNNYDKVYIQYKVKTNNGLICESAKYCIANINGIKPSLLISLKAELDYDNGCINLFLKPNEVSLNKQKINHATYFGKFILSRASEKNNYQIWIPIYKFELTGKLPNKLFTDFTCAQGENYQYCIQQYNDNGIYSGKILTNKILAKFEDIFLYDGERQLKVRFNPKISSFKTVFQESKKTTLGAQYPYFFRNGNVEYKEFPISGLISYVMDENEYFLSKVDNLNMPKDWADNYNITDDNLTYERKFKDEVLNWLNNGQLKLFRSAAEGNYIIRLMNTSLTANDTVSRMLATFTTTATEAIEYNDNNLLDYKFFDNSLHIINSDLFYYTIDLHELTTKNSADLIRNTDFLFGYKCTYFKIDNLNMSSPLLFTLDERNYIISNNYNHEMYFNEPKSNLYFTNLSAADGMITIGIECDDQSKYNLIESINSYKQIDCLNYIGSNWISRYQGIIEEDFAQLKGSAYSLDELYKIPLNSLQIGDIYQINNEYYQYTINNSYNTMSSWSKYKKVNIKNEISKIYSITFTLNNQFYKFNTIEDLQSNYACILTKNNNKYEITLNSEQNDFIPGQIFVISKYYENNQYKGELILSYEDNNNLIILPQYKFYDIEYGLSSLLENQIYIDGKVYNLNNDKPLIIDNFDSVPNIIQWGYRIKAFINYEIVQKNYSIDNLATVKNAYNLYNYSKCCCAAQALKLKRYINKPSIPDITFTNLNFTTPKNVLYYWNGICFEPTTENELLEYWMPVSNDIYDLNDSITINGESYTNQTLINNYILNRDNYFIQLNNNATVAIENKIFEGNDYGISII